jgi:hypothetical protein
VVRVEKRGAFVKEKIRVGMLAAIFGVALNCGGDTPGLDGQWSTMLNDSCGLGLQFDGKIYLLQLACITGSNSGSVQANRGTYADDGSHLVMTPTDTTCPDDPSEAEILNATYEMRGADVLFFSVPAEGLALQMNRNKASGTSSTGLVIQFGCFGNMGTFTPGGLKPISR